MADDDSKDPLMSAKESDYEYEPATKDQLVFEQGCYGLRSWPNSNQTTAVGMNNDQKRQIKIPLVVIYSGKLHIVTREEFQEKVSYFAWALRCDAMDLYGNIVTDRDLYKTVVTPDNFIVKAFVQPNKFDVIYLEKVKKAKKPSLNQFDKLLKRTMDVRAYINQTRTTYEEILKTGLDLAVIRADHERLMQNVGLFHEKMVASAKRMARGAEFVEGASFQILTMVTDTVARTWIQKALYRIGLIMLRGTARSVGAAWAYKSPDYVIEELFAVLKADVPDAIVDLILDPIDKAARARGDKTIPRAVLRTVIQAFVEFLCELALLINEKSYKINEEDFKQIGEKILTGVVANVLSMLWGGRPTDGPIRKAAYALVESTMNAIFRDWMAAVDAAEKAGKPAWRLFLEELPWTIVKIIQGTLVGIFQRNFELAQYRAAGERVLENKYADYLKAQPPSSIYIGKFKKAPEHLGQDPKQVLPAMTEQEHNNWRDKTNLHPYLAAHLRRYANNYNRILTLRLIKKSMSKHLKDLSKFFKPVWIKAKTSDYGPHEGLVQKPTKEPPTHQDFKSAMEKWNEGLPKIKDNGAFVRQDGIVFHPEMLPIWAATLPERGDLRSVDLSAHALKILGEAKNAGHYDFTNSESRRWLENKYTSKEDKDAIDFINKASVGYHSDTDVHEEVDAGTGDRNVLGSGGERDDELFYVRRNQVMISKAVNIKDDLRNMPKGFSIDDVDLKPHYYSIVQHGGDYEFIGEGAGGDLLVILSDGRFEIITSGVTGDGAKRNSDIHNQYEALLKRELKDNYQ